MMRVLTLMSILPIRLSSVFVCILSVLELMRVCVLVFVYRICVFSITSIAN